MQKMTVQQWRLVKGMTQLEMAKLIGMSVSTYQTKESGRSSWKADEIKMIARKLEISIENQLDY